MTEMVYYYDGSFDGLRSCIFDSYAYRERPVAIYREEDGIPTLFASRTVTTDTAHARRVLRKVAACSPAALELLHKGVLTCLPDKEVYLYRLWPSSCGRGPASCETSPTRRCTRWPPPCGTWRARPIC